MTCCDNYSAGFNRKLEICSIVIYSLSRQALLEVGGGVPRTNKACQDRLYVTMLHVSMLGEGL